eukprot:scaffold7254_cov49-Attheya_sp.AAC.5
MKQLWEPSKNLLGPRIVYRSENTSSLMKVRVDPDKIPIEIIPVRDFHRMFALEIENNATCKRTVPVYSVQLVPS